MQRGVLDFGWRVFVAGALTLALLAGGTLGHAQGGYPIPPSGEGFIYGTVVEAGDSTTSPVPIANAKVIVHFDIESFVPMPPIAETQTDENGEYRIENLPTDPDMPLRIVADKMGYYPEWVDQVVLTAEGREIHFALRPMTGPAPTPPPGQVLIYGRVMTKLSTGAEVPVAGAYVQVRAGEAEITIWPPPPPVAADMTDSLGRYSMLVPSDLLLPSRIIASKEGFLPQEKRIEVLPPVELRVDFELLPSPAPPPLDGFVEGVVYEGLPLPSPALDTAQEIPDELAPLAGARVTVHLPSDATNSNVGRLLGEAITDEQGHYRIDRLPVDIPLAGLATKEGYTADLKPIDALTSQGLELNFILHALGYPTLTPTPSPTGPPPESGICGLVVEESMLTVIIPIKGALVEAFPADWWENPDHGMMSTLQEMGGMDPSWHPEPAGSAVTDENGHFCIVPLPPGPYYVRARAEGYYPTFRRVEVTEGNPVETVLALRPVTNPTPTPTPTPIPDAGAIYGMVYNALAMSPLPAPIAGAEVLVFPQTVTDQASNSTDNWPLPVLGRATTNDEGRYRIENLPPIPVWVRAFHPGYYPETVDAVVRPSTDTMVSIGLRPWVGTPTPTPTPPPPEEAEMFGRVNALLPDGSLHPLAGAKVCLFAPTWDGSADLHPEPVACAETNEEGRYRLWVAPGEYVAVAHAMGFAREWKRVSLAAGPNGPIDFALRPAPSPSPTPLPEFGRVEGVCVTWWDPLRDMPAVEPRPVPDAEITLYRAEVEGVRIGDPVARTRTDERGHFAFERIPAGLYIGVAEKPGFERDVETARVFGGETTRMRFEMKPVEPTPTPIPELGGLAGRVLAAATDDTTTHPVAGALVSVFRINLADMADAAVRPVAVTATDEEGLWGVRGLLPGEYLVVAAKRGYESDRARTVVEPGQVSRVRLVLIPVEPPDPSEPGSIEGRVMKPTQEAMDSARTPIPSDLALEPVEGSTVTSFLVLVNTADPADLVPSGRAVTDAEGRFRLAELDPGIHLVVAQAEGLHPSVQLARVEPGTVTRMLLILRPMESSMGPWPPQEIVDRPDPGNDEAAHWEAQGSGAFEWPDFDRRNGWLVLRSRNNTSCFGYWQSVRGWVPRHADALYVVSFTVASDQADPSRSPSLRLRVNSDTLQQTDIFRITSLGDAGLAPTLTGTSYRMYFEPMDPGMVQPEGRDGMNVSFDLLNFDRDDAADGELALTSLTIDAVPLDQLGGGTELKTWTFEDGSSGWQFAGAPEAFALPEAEASGAALRLRTRSQNGVFGYWHSPSGDLQAPPGGEMVRATFRVRSDAVDPEPVTQMRVRLNSEDGQAAVLKVVASRDGGENSPTAEGKEYRVYFEVPPALAGQDLIASFDLLGFDPADAAECTLILDRVTVEQVPAPLME